MNKVRSIYLYICLTLIILAGAAFFAFKPFTAEAEEAEHNHDGITFTAWTGTTSLPDSGSYYLEYDVPLSVWLDTSANLNLCLNGHTITYDGTPIRVRSGGTLGIYDCQGNGAVTADGYCIRIFSGGTANIYGGTFNSTDYEAITVDVGGTVTIENASVFSSNSRTILNNGMATINGGTFENTAAGYPTIQLQSGSTTKITGGTFIRNVGSNIIQNQGRLEMSGGIVTGKSTDDRGAVGITNYGAAATATIKNVTVTTVGEVTDDDTKVDKGLRNDNGGIMTVENCNVTSTHRAVWNTGSSKITISSGTFNGSYGMYNNSGTFELSGSPTFTGSTADIYLSDGQKITVTGTLGSAAPYSVLTATDPTPDSPVEITNSSTTSYNDKTKFTSKNSSYVVRKDSSTDQLELAVPETYTITYDKGTGSDITGSIPSGTKTEGTDFTLSSETFTRTGYIQTGWSTTDGGAKEYDLGGTYTDDADITLYPYWTECGHDSEDPIWTDDKNDDGTHSRVCDVCGETVTEVHHWDRGTPTKEATATENGEMLYTCKVCEATYTKEIPATGGTGDSDDNTDPSDGKNDGNITINSKSGENAPDVSISDETSSKLKDEVIASHLTPEEKEKIANGDNLDIILMVEDAGDTVPATDKQAAKAVLTNTEYTLGMYLNIDLIKVISGKHVGKITEINSPIRVTIEIPENLRNNNRKFVIVRVHNGVAEILEDVDYDPDTITIVTNKFSTYSIAYQDTKAANHDNPNNPNTPNTGTTTPVTGTADNSSSDSNNTSNDSNSVGEDVSSAAGLYGANELLGDTVSVVDMFIPVGIVLVSMMFIIRKRSKANK